MTPPSSKLFGEPLHVWQHTTRESLGIETEKNTIVVGHQPIFFHPGILAKFIAASESATSVGGTLVHLVADHYIGHAGVIDMPMMYNGELRVETAELAKVDATVSMKDQLPVETSAGAPDFARILEETDEPNAAMQFAAATDSLMAPYATVHHRVAATDLLQSPIGIAILDHMFTNPRVCNSAYNNAVAAFPSSGIPFLSDDELPLWHGSHNAPVRSLQTDLRPRALLLTLLARLCLGDLFVHGTGGASYDLAMEHWASHWLGIDVCPSVVVSATLHLPLDVPSIQKARREYFSGVGSIKQLFLEDLRSLPRRSPAKTIKYLEMHRWLATCGKKPDQRKYAASRQVASRRDWAFPLYPRHMLQSLCASMSRSFV